MPHLPLPDLNDYHLYHQYKDTHLIRVREIPSIAAKGDTVEAARDAALRGIQTHLVTSRAPRYPTLLEPKRDFMWVAKRRSRKMTLYATMKASDPGFMRFSPRVDEEWAKATRYVLTLDPNPEDQVKFIKAHSQGAPLSGFLGKILMKEVEVVLSQHDVDLEPQDYNLEPTAVLILFEQWVQSQDAVLRDLAVRSEKPMSGLTDLEELWEKNTMPPEAAVALLRMGLGSGRFHQPEIRKRLTPRKQAALNNLRYVYWRGDAQMAEAVFLEEAGWRERLWRVRKLYHRLERVLHKGGRPFVACWIHYLLGPGGILDLLEMHGWDIVQTEK